MSDEMIKTITGAGFSVDEFLKVCKTIGGLGLASSAPQLIQGYTAEEWQEIIDGGYLCEFACDDSFHSNSIRICTLTGYESWITGFIFSSNFQGTWSYCRPSQIKGVMRPIFVEPENREAFCHFFSGSGSFLLAGKWEETGTATKVAMQVKLLSGATKYIEV